MASNEATENPIQHKRPLEVGDVEPVPSEGLASHPSKRICREAAPSHLTLLEEFCGLSAEAESILETHADESSTPEDLVAEMMRSLEKVIGSEETPEECGSTGQHADPACYVAAVGAARYDEDARRDIAYVGEEYAEESGRDDEIRLLMEASDDELGIPSCTANLGGVNFEEEWASSISDEPAAVASYGWLDCSLLHQIEDSLSFASRDLYEPVILF